MSNSNKENNPGHKNHRKHSKKDNNLKEKLLSENKSNKISNKKDGENIVVAIPNYKEETSFTENMEEETNIPLQNNENINNNKNNRQYDKKNRIKKNDSEYSLELCSKNDITIPEFSNSNINRNSFQKMVEENNKIIDKKIIEKEKDTNISKIGIFLFIIELIFGILLSISSISILIIIYMDDIVDQKYISFFIEPIIFIISILGIIPYKGKSLKIIIISLYLWEGLFLFPLSFYSISIIKNKNFYYICFKIDIARIILLSVQFMNFVISLILKIDI